MPIFTRRDTTSGRRRRRLLGGFRWSAEQLEGRALLAGIPFTFTFDDPSDLFGSYDDDLLSNLRAAGQILSGRLGGLGSMDVSVRPDNSAPRANGGSAQVSFVRSEGGFNIFENSTITEAKTGTDPNGTAPDIIININTNDYLPTAWFDPSGAARTATVPNDKLDFISVALHEIVHALGFQGYREISGSNYGGFPGDYKTTYDALTDWGTGANASVLYFDGPAAEAEYGGPVPLTSVGPSQFLTSQNFFHVGNPAGSVGSELIPDLMNGVVFTYGTRYDFGDLDQAILSDLGWGTVPSQTPTLSIAGATVNEGGTGSVNVTLSSPSTQVVTVSYATADGTATAGADYSAASGTLTFAPGETSKTIVVPILNDSAVEGPESFTVALSDPDGAPLGGPATATVTIVDNDHLVAGDYDGDKVTDTALYRYDPFNHAAVFDLLLSNHGTPLSVTRTLDAAPGVVPVTGDFDGDGKADLAVYDPQGRILGSAVPNAAVWTYLRSSDNQLVVYPFGGPGTLDRPAPGDFDGDGRTDIATFRANSDLTPGAAEWFVLGSSGGAFRVAFGAPGGADLPAVADFDGDGRDDIAVFRPVPTPQDEARGIFDAAQWFILPSGRNDLKYNPRAGGYAVVFGAAGNADQPAVSDLNGDGRADIVAFRSRSDLAPGHAQWFVYPSSGPSPAYGGPYALTFGLAGDIAAVGDYDGDGRPDPAFFNPTTGRWTVRGSATGHDREYAFGATGGASVPVLAPLYFRLLATGNPTGG